jgi:hypothetical protein
MPEKFEVNTDFINKYHGKRLEFRLCDETVISGRVGQMDQSDLDDLGVELTHVMENGESLDYGVIIPESSVLSFSESVMV